VIGPVYSRLGVGWIEMTVPKNKLSYMIGRGGGNFTVAKKKDVHRQNLDIDSFSLLELFDCQLFLDAFFPSSLQAPKLSRTILKGPHS
jgi:hypothetical protein